MTPLLVLIIVVITVYCSISWLIPQLLAWLFKRKYKVELKVGRIVLPTFILKDVNIVKNGYSVHIEEVSLHSSLFNSEVSKLVSIVIRDVRVNKDVVEKKGKESGGLPKSLISKQNSLVTSVIPGTVSDVSTLGDAKEQLNCMARDILDFRDTKLPTGVLLCAQFLSVRIQNLSVMVLGGGWLCHCVVGSAGTGGVGAGPGLQLAAALTDLRAKLLRRHPEHSQQTCLAEVSFGLNLDVTLVVETPLNVEKVQCSISNCTATLNEGIYKFVQERSRVSKSSSAQPSAPHVLPRGVSVVNPDPLFHRIAPLIPKNFSLKVYTTTITGVRDNSRTDFCSSLHSLQVNTRFSASQSSNVNALDLPTEITTPPRLPQVYLAFQMDQFKINSNKEKLLFLNKLKLDAKLEKEVLNLYLIVNVLNLSYNHDDVYRWWSTTFPPQDLDLVPERVPIEKQSGTGKVPSWLEELCGLCVVQGCAELWGVTLGGRRGSHHATLACSGLKVKLDQLADTRGIPYRATLPRLILGMRHWSTELLVDSAWLQSGVGDAPLKRHHSWGTGFFVGVALLKWGSHANNSTKIEAMLDCLRSEWGPNIARTILLLLECYNDYKKYKKYSFHTTVPAKTTNNKLSINMTLTNVNIFMLAENDICLMSRIDAISVEKNSVKLGLVISGFKMADVVPFKGHYVCQRAEEMAPMFCYVKLTRCEFENGASNIQLLEIVEGQWSANLHLKCLTIVKDFKAFKEDLRESLNLGRVEMETPQEVKEKLFCVTFKGDIAVRLVLSDEHNMLFSFDEISFRKDHNGFSMSWNSCHLAIDDAEIFTVDGLLIERIHDSLKIREERQNADEFILDWNKTWGITILSFRAVFPHQHNFAVAVQDEFVGLTKWIKLIHNYKKTEFTATSPLPSDLFIKIDDFILEMTDDPFEIKLRDNYELLEDEYKESLKRKSMLDAKVAELCKPHLFLPAGKVEELYAGLGRRNAQIYVQRSRQLAAGAAGRPLLCCRLRHTQVLALADPSLHGKSNCVDLLQELDPDSPWPEETPEFTTLWCRWITGWCTEWRLQLRDFPQPLLRTADLQLWGLLMGAEQKPPPRARRLSTVQQGAPWGPIQIERSMTSLKFYHDLNCEMDQYTYAFGPCWEPVIAQCNISWDQVMRGSRDPSAALPWWDKLRLLAHGRLTLCVRRLALLLHASLNPYNTTEEMELAWTDLALDWTNAKIVFKGDLNVYVRTASKYDDCRLLHLPNLRLTLKLSWLCLADPNDHYSVVQCAPNKVPEYSSNQEHDSFRAFRSQGVGVHLAFETRPSDDSDGPVLLLYGSTLRWFESLKQILSGATRPTRRGALFHSTKPRRPQLSRHIRTARLSLALHRFQVCYWMSFAMQRGVEVCGRRVTCGAQHTLVLVPSRDGLKRRSRATWPPLYINCELNDAEVWLKSALHYDPDKESMWFGQPVEKCYCLSVGKVSYGREGLGGALPPGPDAPPTHRLVVHDLRAAWTKPNRDVAFALFDTYMKNKQLKKNLSTEALKIFRSEDSESALQNGRAPDTATPATPPTSTAVQSGAGQTQALLAQLVAEAEHKAVVFSDDLSESNTQPPPHAPAPDDSSICNWLIALVNAQVVLRGCETRGYVVLCAARAEVRQRLRRSRCTWAGSLQSMQYYATVSARDNEQLHQNIQWVCVEEIEDKGARAISALPDVPRLVGSGHSAGGVLGSTVGPSADQADAPQLQRIVSRCTCEFYYVSYEETGGAGETGAGVSWEEPETPCDTFTLMHHDLDVCTNSLQYAMLLDVVNNLVLYVEPQRKRALERLARMRFQLQLHRVPDPRRPIQLLQNQVRGLVAQLRRLERETYLVQRAISEGAGQQQELQELQRQVTQCKDQLTRDGEELHAMVACYQESRYRAPATQARPAAAVKVNEICFKHAQWRLTDADGQLGIADLVLTNFQYTKNTKSDDSVEHLLELGYVRMTNLLPNEPYAEVLLPTEVRSHMPVARQRVLRLFCRERPPVGGISVKEHFEINVVPITIGLTKKFYNTMLKFCFPERDPDTIDSMEPNLEEDDTASMASGGGGGLRLERGTSRNKIKSKKLGKDTNFYVKIDQKDDVEKMKERAEKNKLFIYIKIPEVPVRVSYKGNKEKNLEDLRDISIVIPTLEYHNVTWTWLDLLLAMKSDSRRVILPQAIRQKLQLHRNRGAASTSTVPPEEDKARMLLGDRRPESKSHKKGVPVAFKFPK